jgi:ketosteroid isomerase-like protein
MKYILITVAFLASIISSCNTNNSSNADGNVTAFDKIWATSFIDSVNAKFSQQIAAGDSSALAANYWPDAELLMGSIDVIKGADILPAWGYSIRAGLKEMSFSTTDIIGSADHIIETGNYQMKGKDGALIDRGKYVVIWTKRDGQWKLYRDIGCTSVPVATP